MKRFAAITAISALIASLASCTTSVPREDVQVGPYTVSEIERNVYHIQDFNDANPAGESFDATGTLTHFNNCSDIYLVVGSKKALLIDLSNDIKWADNAAESLRSIVSERTAGKPLTITFTHNHGDHIGMLPAYKDDPEVKFALPDRDFRTLVNPAEAENIEFFSEGYRFELGGLTVEAVAVPGHTEGSMVFNLLGHNILFTGDAIGSGHGVWIFNYEAFYNYISAVPHLVDYIEDPASRIDKDALRIYGGHYWQRDWLGYSDGQEMGWQYICDMQTLLDQIEDGTAHTEPSNLGRPNLDTYFRNGEAIITWNSREAEYFRSLYTEKKAYRDQYVVFRQIDEHTWEGNGHLCFNESVYLIEGEERALLIDAGTNIPTLADAVAKLTDKPVTLVATHVHGDHTGMSINLFPELWINPADVFQIGFDFNDAAKTAGEFKCAVKFLQDGQVFDLGGRQIEVIFTPGHTPGSTTFIDRDNHYGFSGDSFGSTNLLLFTNFSTLINTTSRMAAYMKKYGITKLYPGHYGGVNCETLKRVEDLEKMSREVLAGTRKPIREGDEFSRQNSYIRDFGVTVRFNAPAAVK